MSRGSVRWMPKPTLVESLLALQGGRIAWLAPASFAAKAVSTMAQRRRNCVRTPKTWRAAARHVPKPTNHMRNPLCSAAS